MTPSWFGRLMCCLRTTFRLTVGGCWALSASPPASPMTATSAEIPTIFEFRMFMASPFVLKAILADGLALRGRMLPMLHPEYHRASSEGAPEPRLFHDHHVSPRRADAPDERGGAQRLPEHDPAIGAVCEPDLAVLPAFHPDGPRDRRTGGNFPRRIRPVLQDDNRFARRETGIFHQRNIPSIEILTGCELIDGGYHFRRRRPGFI